MIRLLRTLNVDLHIEHDGHHLKLSGSRMNFIANFPTLASLFHFSRIFWPLRNQAPPGTSFHVEWRKLRIPIQRAKRNISA